MSTTINNQLRAVWRRQQAVHHRSGWLTFARWSLALFLVAVALDWLFKLPASARLVLLFGLLVVALFNAWQRGWRHLRRFDATRTALRVESHYGDMDSLLVTGLQFSNDESVGGSRAMRERTCQLAEYAAASVRPKESVSFRPLHRLAQLALIPMLLLGCVALYNPAFLGAGFARIFTPWRTVDYPTRTQIELADGNRIAKEGEAIRLAATITGDIPKDATIILRTGEGKPRERSLPIRDGVCAYEAETVFRSFDYRIAAGDTRSAWHTVEVIAAPRIERAEVQLTFPEYTRRPSETVEALTLTLPEGTQIRWNLTLDRALKEAEFQPAAGNALPLKIGPDGQTVTMKTVANESRAYRFGWVDQEHGFDFSSPRYYLQVAPDQAPTVELTKPAGNLFATLERDLAFAFRGRDDHGIGEASIAYRVNKTAEETVALPTPKTEDGSAQTIDWNYREALPDLAVGDTVTFAVELADRYPSTNGPHRVRSDARRVQFLSRADYLAHVAKQKRRLLAQVRGIYREERGIHALVRGLDPAAVTFVQTCQLEAVRQDLMRERLAGLRSRIDALMDDLAANNVSNEVERVALLQLNRDLQTVSEQHIKGAATALRSLAAVSDGIKDPSPAVHAVDQSARELGLLVLQLGFAEASDVMARELHATAQSQASLRQQTIRATGDTKALAEQQTRLATETARLLAATPSNMESSSKNALIAFKLSRLVNGMLRAGTDKKMHQVAKELGTKPEAAAGLQAEVIAALLAAEFRLRAGAEYEALSRARDLFTDLAAKLPTDDKAGLTGQLQLLLMPEIPATPARLFDQTVPTAPAVGSLIGRAERALNADQDDEAKTAFEELATITAERMEAMNQPARMKSVVANANKQAAQLLILEERLLLLLEEVEDAADDERNLAFLAVQNQALADDVTRFAANIRRLIEGESADRPLLGCLERAGSALNTAAPSIKANEPDAVIEQHEFALEALEEAIVFNDELAIIRTAFASVLEITDAALAPSPLLIEIEQEQERLSAATETAKPEDRSSLVIPQKNLIHAVDAILTSLDPLAHKIETGTVMLFAKEDMDAAAIGIEEDDLLEALDAQAFVVESLQDLRAKIDRVTPEYRYIRELTEFLYGVAPKAANIRSAVLLPDAETEALKARINTFGTELKRLTGDDTYLENADQLAKAIDTNDEDAIEDALDQLADRSADLQLLMENLAHLVTPPPVGVMSEPTPEVMLTHKVLAVAAHHQDLTRETRSASPDTVTALFKRQDTLAKQCKACLPSSNPPPQLVAAQAQLATAAAQLKDGKRDAALAAQARAQDELRHFILAYALAFVEAPPPPPPQDPSPDGDLTETEGDLQLFMPGALTGTRPKGGRLEWQVLGQRDRAALNENFARELPLEYRAILKDYYERLAQ